MKKNLGIFGLFVAIFLTTTLLNPQFVGAVNVENLIRWTALFGLISIGASFVIVTSGIDLSTGSVIGLCGCLLSIFLTASHGEPTGAYVVKQVDKKTKLVIFEGELPPLQPGDQLVYKSASGTERKLHVERAARQAGAAETEVYLLEEPTYLDPRTEVAVSRQERMNVLLAVSLVMLVSVGIGLVHGLLITKVRLQPFVVTLCGMLVYRSAARFIAGDQMQGFGANLDALRYLVGGRPFSIPVPFLRWIAEGNWTRYQWDYSNRVPALGADGAPIPLDLVQWVAIPMPVLILIAVAIAAGIFMNYSIFGRYLLALGRNEQAARYSGINTDRMIILAYVLCAMLSGLAGMLFALDLNSVQPSGFGQTYELYAIAAAVLGGCSLRGGENSVVGVVIGTAVMRTLNNAINMVGVPSSLEFGIIGGVILAGAIVDELLKRLAVRRRAWHEAAQS
jgi:ribose transport system permease protein